MKILAGVDIGNSTTEVCLAVIKDDHSFSFLSSNITKTTGIKGTVENVKGVKTSLEGALRKINLDFNDVDLIRINEASPVIGDTAMETITETIITESTMIGHNPSSPGGLGVGVGYTINLKQLYNFSKEKDYIVIIDENVTYEEAADIINNSATKGMKIKAAIMQKDEGVLVCNRLHDKIPIVDEVKFIDKIPLGFLAAVEVCDIGHTVKELSNPYGIATIFNLTPEETKQIIPVAKSLIGTRSAVVIKTPKGEVKEKVIPAGKIYIYGNNTVEEIDLELGAEEIMKKISEVEAVEDIVGEQATNVGGMLNGVKLTMSNLTEEQINEIKIKDILAIDTTLPVKVTGGLAGETFIEKAVAIAAMVKTKKLPMEIIAEKLQNETGSFVNVAGVEAVMAVLGAITTPGIKLPLAILDLGGGSTDAAIIDEEGVIKSIHLAGAGQLVTMLINSELGLEDKTLAEEIKKYPVAKVESLFSIRMENREVKFFEDPLNPKYFGRVVLLKDKMIPIYKDISLEKIVEVRRKAKERVFVENAKRALKIIAPINNIRNIPNVVLVGGSALDFEIPEMIFKELSKYKVVSGRGNIRRSEGPRNAVATGLVMSYIGK